MSREAFWILLNCRKIVNDSCEPLKNKWDELKTGFQWDLEGKEAQFHVPIIQVFLSHSEKTTISPVRQWSDESNKDPGARFSKVPVTLRARGPFLESPGNFSGPKSNIQIEI